jgi:hypothetical protein
MIRSVTSDLILSTEYIKFIHHICFCVLKKSEYTLESVSVSVRPAVYKITLENLNRL